MDERSSTAELQPNQEQPSGQSRLRSLVVVTDNPMMAAAIRASLRDGDAFRLLGYLDPARASAGAIKDSDAEVVLIDEAGRPDEAISLIGSIKDESENIAIVFLALQMDPALLQRAFDAGASSAISKSIHPSALATFLDEALKGHIVHRAISGSDHEQQATTLACEHRALTRRELAILQLVAAGGTNHQIAQELWITRQTVKFHVSNIYRKLGVNNRTEACHYAHTNGMLTNAQREHAPLAS